MPLNTVEATKLISTKLKISPEVSMVIMEKLYNQGYLSYPRTETTIYNPNIDLRQIVNRLKTSQTFGLHAQQISNGSMWAPPRKGSLDDKAHPPIHPVKCAEKSSLQDE